ncbi:MAG: hypothetical protein IH845_03195 [Nanoarchaeota archaeon]|nr:hypothetical protein [Nanoarchaeota archaeon]
MRKGEDAFALVGSLFVAFLLMNFVSIYYFDLPLLPVTITGNVVDSGIIDLFVEGNPKIVTIHYPLNATYNFSIGDNYSFVLNVSADFLVDNWTYSLYDVRHDKVSVTDVIFTPNSSFFAVRWNNNLTVNAHEFGGLWHSQSVFFYVNVPNTAPILSVIDDQIYVCEGQQLTYPFNATDLDEFVSPGRELKLLISGDLPISVVSQTHNDTVKLYILRTSDLNSDKIGSYVTDISVNDQYNATCCVDTATTNITVIELNDEPVAPSIGTRTVYGVGENSSFNYAWAVTDNEDGNAMDGNMTFNISWNGTQLFTINSSTGVMNFTPSGESLGTYFPTVCVSDSALSSPHQNISLCSEFGDASINTHCDSFNFVITNDNRPPEITGYTPLNTNFSVEGTTSTTFTVNVTDPDMVNAYPDINWYVEGVLKRAVENESTDTFSYSFGCGVSGTKDVTVITTDDPKFENDSQSWEIDVLLVACPISSSSGGGGGGGGAFSGLCNEQWVCNDFDVCQNVERSFDARIISAQTYSDSNEICSQKELGRRECGFQITTCFDLAECNNTIFKVPKPIETRICHYTEEPSCFDGITNCHDGSCELLVDCGGTCGPCATCTDNIQNQGEGNIDCGGPCPFVCEKESPYGATSYTIVFLFIVAVIILLFIIFKLFKILRHRFLLYRKRHK